MKRDPALRDLSVDHHHALVLARRATRVAAGEVDEPLETTWTLVCESFERELEPHFVTEETLLLPLLSQIGENELVRRTHEDHRQLRALVVDTESDLRSRLASFANASPTTFVSRNANSSKRRNVD